MKKKRRRIKSTKQPETVCSTEYKGKPAFILAADTHIRDIAPACRTDNYIEAVFRKLEFLKQTATKYKIDILHSGDIGDKCFFVKRENEKDKAVGWTAEVYNRFVDMFTENIVSEPFEPIIRSIPGNHDLPNHDINNLNKSVFHSLMSSKAVHILDEDRDDNYVGYDVYGCAWDCEIPKPAYPDNINILVIHKMIINQLPLWPGQVAPKAIDILKQNPDYNLIVSGDNHDTFVAEYNNRILVNSGSMMRSTTKQFDHKPCFFLYYPESHTIEKIFYPIESPENVISLKHIELKNKNSERTTKYADLVNKSDISDLRTFKENTEIFIADSNISKNVVKHIRGFVNHEQPIETCEPGPDRPRVQQEIYKT